MLRQILLGILFLAFIPAAHAQNRVSEAEFLSVLHEDGPAFASLTERLGAARAARSRAGLLSNPTISFEHEAPGKAEQTTWRLAWTPPLDAGRGAGKRSAEAGVQSAERQLEADRLRLRSQLRQAFADWALGQERRDTAVSHLESIRRLADQMRVRARSGEESGLASRRVSLAALEVEAEAARAEAEAARFRALALSWNPSLLPASLPARPPLPALADTVATTRPDILALEREVEQSEWEVQHQGRFLSAPELSFGWERIRGQGEKAEGPVFGASWDVPLFDRKQPGRIEAAARLIAARGRLEIVRARAERERAAARAAYARLRASALGAIETAGEGDQVIDSAAARFRLGESRLTDLLETLRSVLAARLAAIELYA
ncbi:MAG TPA: TolC family protein, partial [Candidatus Eisenbacteria bacterium]|nr:TolC family protein [Candidatus Eisenbacteria bacterium]